MKVMKTIFFAFLLLVILVSGCRKPALPSGEPTLEVTFGDKPAQLLPWKVVKGKRLAINQPCTYTTNFSSKKSSLKNSRIGNISE